MDTGRPHLGRRGLCSGNNQIRTVVKDGEPWFDIYRLVMKSKLPSAEKFEEWVLQPIAWIDNTPGLTCLQAVTCIVSAPAWMVSPCRMSKAAEVWRLYSTGLLPPSLVGGGRNL